MLKWALTGADKEKVTATGNAAHDLNALYETGKETVLNKADRINNVYDLEGNGGEWTAEAYNTSIRNYRGGLYYYGNAPSYRFNGYSISSNYDKGCSRTVLIIK